MIKNENYVPPSEQALKRLVYGRIGQLKLYKELANVILNQNKVYKASTKKTSWQSSAVEHNKNVIYMTALEKIIDTINEYKKIYSFE